MPAAATVDDSAVEEHLTAAHLLPLLMILQSKSISPLPILNRVQTMAVTFVPNMTIVLPLVPSLQNSATREMVKARCALTHVDPEPETRECDRIRVAADCDDRPVSWLPSAANIGTTFDVCNVAMVDISTMLDNEFSAALGFANPASTSARDLLVCLSNFSFEASSNPFNNPESHCIHNVAIDWSIPEHELWTLSVAKILWWKFELGLSSTSTLQV